MQRYSVLKALSGGQKVFKLAGVGLDRRQGVILVASIFAYWLLYKQLAQAVALSTAQAVVLFFPLVVFAFLLAFAKHDGRHLDWWIQKKAQSRMRPKILKWKRKHPRRKKPLRDSIQEALPAERIAWEMLRTRDGTYVLVFRVDAVSLSLAGDAEKERVWAASAQLYNRLDFPIIEMTRSREGNVATYTQTLREHVTSQVSSEEPDLARFSRQHLEFLENIVPSYNVFDRTGYVILPYKPPGKSDASREKKKPKPRDAARLQREAEEAYRELSNRADIVFDAFMRIGARLQVLTDVELLDFLKGQTAGEDYSIGGAPVLWEPVTLEAGGYGELSPKKLKEVLAVAEKVRREAPPAVGIGDLALADRVSPDAVRINADYLRVGGRYHATLFVYEWPDSVHFGILQSLLHVPGRIKVVKYVKPLPQDKAIGTLGSQVAELQAAEHTASDGNVISSQQRAIARYSAETAMDELISDKQSLFDVSFLVHCEADSKDELHSLVESVRTKLAGIRIEAKLAREEAWEGFVSTLPLGQNLLSKRYANKGMLTNPLACLFVYGSYQVNHPDGILLGVDPVAGGLVVLDSRELMNPHMVILGTSGGGKSQTVKAVSSRLRMRGQRVVVIDPVGDSRYGPVAKALNGEYVVFGVGSPHKFNPCDLRGGYVNLNLLAGAVDEEDPEAARRKARVAALDGKILMLTRLVSLMIASDDGAGGLTTGEQGLVDKLWQEVYAEKGITRDPDTHDREPPTFNDFFRHLTNVPELRHLREQLYPWESGALRTFFDSQTNVNLDNRYLVLQIAGVSGREKATIMYALLDFLNGRLSDPDELSNCFIDEFWSLLKYPMAAEFCEELWRSGRARNNAMVGISQDVEEFVHSRHGQVVLRLSATHLILRQRKRTVEVLQDFYDFSEEQRQQVMNLQAGEGYLVVEENQVPLYVICSEHELRLFNTDPKKELEYRREEQRLLEEDTIVGATGGNPAWNGYSHPPENPNASLSGEEGGHVTRRLTPVGRARQLLDDEERPVPAVEDYEEIPREEAYLPEDGPREPERQTADEREERIAIPEERGASSDTVVGPPTGDVLHLSVPPSRGRPGGAPVYAVVGPTSGLVAYNLAGMLARAGKDEDRRILFVDAEAYVSEVVLEKLGQERPDEMLLRGGDLREYVAHEADSNLFVLMHPGAPGLTAANLVEATRGAFDAVIAACSDSRYARDWLCSADRVVATDSNTRSLETILKRVEALRGENGTLLAPMGRLKLNPELMSHRVFRLPSAREQAFREAEERASFATLADEDTRRAFRPLLEELINATREELSHE